MTDIVTHCWQQQWLRKFGLQPGAPVLSPQPDLNQPTVPCLFLSGLWLRMCSPSLPLRKVHSSLPRLMVRSLGYLCRALASAWNPAFPTVAGVLATSDRGLRK